MAASLIPSSTARRFGLLRSAKKTQLARKETKRKKAWREIALSSDVVRDRLVQAVTRT